MRRNTQTKELIKICHPSKTHNMKGRRKKQTSPIHNDKSDSKQPKLEKNYTKEWEGPHYYIILS